MDNRKDEGQVREIEKSVDPLAGFALEDLVVEAYEGGLALKKVALVTKLPISRVSKILYNRGVKLRKQGGPNNKGKRKLAHLTAAQLTGKITEIAAAYGVHESTVIAERKLREVELEHRSGQCSTTGQEELPSYPGQGDADGVSGKGGLGEFHSDEGRETNGEVPGGGSDQGD